MEDRKVINDARICLSGTTRRGILDGFAESIADEDED